jgi:hypothetical protein
LETESIADKINQFQVDLGGSNTEPVYGEQIKLSRQTSAYVNKVCRTGDASLIICKLSETSETNSGYSGNCLNVLTVQNCFLQ